MDQGAGQRTALFEASGKGFRFAAGQISQADKGQDLVDSFFQTVEFVGPGKEFYIGPNGYVAVQGRVLRHGLPQDRYLSGSRFDRTHQGLDQV